ncbi:DUF6352 family protein [Tepidamorphus sp. 3E244]|uniref:DUF6352 family protein n=1 Tax=Tepidamorphus sp. 3E244 TaxID=3385498 RepID=UPI0038FBF3A0
MTTTLEHRTVGRDFWRSAGIHLLDRDDNGRLTVTADFLRAYFTRPEIHPVEESCAAENALFEALMEDPLRAVGDAEIAAIADEDARENYRIVVDFRDHLASNKTLEAAYLAIFTSADAPRVPPVFVDQMVHVILANILADVRDPMRLRAAELFFREQNVSLDDGRVMLADEEIVEMYAKTGGMGGLGQLLVESNTTRNVSLDVIDDDNSGIYWERSDRFDTVVDFRFTQPALDAFARVLEAWVGHFFGVRTRIQPMQSIKDERWSWHVGLDAEATRILNGLYNGEDVATADLDQVIALFRMEFADAKVLSASMQGKPVYLGLAMTRGNRLRMKPQNLLTNLPLASTS